MENEKLMAEQEIDDARREQLLLGEREEVEIETELRVMEDAAPQTLAEMAEDEQFRKDFEDWLDGKGEKK
jgi:hypothetical protein